MISLDCVSYNYPGREKQALSDITLKISAEESICILGSNGSGKSTFASLIAGAIKPTKGTLNIFSSHGNKCRKTGMLFQNPDNQTVATEVDKEIAFNLETDAVQLDEMRKRVADHIDSFGLTSIARRAISTLSGGEKQLVSLAAVTIDNPPIIILDEPDAFLDSSGQKLLADEINRLRAENDRLIEIRITHRPSVAEKYSRICILHNGEAVFDGSPDVILFNNNKLFQYGLVDDSTMPGNSMAALRNTQNMNRLKDKDSKISLQQVTFGYENNIEVVSDLSLEINSGEIVAIVGQMGSGKSTIGHLVCGLLTPVSGAVNFQDEKGTQLIQRVQAGTIVGAFQQPEKQFFLESCRDEILFGPRNLGKDLSNDDIASIMDEVGLDFEEFAERDPQALSMGEKRRLAFAALLAMSPSFILFDEPTAGLDLVGESQFIALVGRLRARGVGILIISHDYSLIARIVDRIYLIDKPDRIYEISAKEFKTKELI